MPDPSAAPNSYLRVEGTTWPDPTDPSGVEWRLRYGNPSKSDLLVAASFMHVYGYLMSMSQRDRNHRVQTIKEALNA